MVNIDSVEKKKKKGVRARSNQNRRGKESKLKGEYVKAFLFAFPASPPGNSSCV